VELEVFDLFVCVVNEGPAFKRITSTYYPTVGLHSNGEIVRANFGQDPFKFNIEEMIMVSFLAYFLSLSLS
jgi:hypothetical protein